jgi:hypothetical protein
MHGGPSTGLRHRRAGAACALETWALFCRNAEQKRARELLIQSRELLKQMQIG